MRITLRKSVGRVSYLLDGVVLPTVSTYIDLGVYVDSTLSFTLHVNYIVSIAKQSLSDFAQFS